MGKLECPLRKAESMGGSKTRFDDCEQGRCAWWIQQQAQCSMAVLAQAALAWWASATNAANQAR